MRKRSDGEDSKFQRVFTAGEDFEFCLLLYCLTVLITYKTPAVRFLGSFSHLVLDRTCICS